MLALAGCQSVLTPCVDPRLELYCYHSEADRGPVGHAPGDVCAPPELPPNAEPCGEYEVSTWNGGFTSVTHYFRDGAHVATRYGTDVNVYCGGFQYWYGDRVECTPE